MIKEKENLIVIVGLSLCGKTTLAERLAREFPEYTVIHTDDYMEDHSFEEGMYVILDEVVALVNSGNDKIIVEGIQGYRMLRKGVELNKLYPDLVIHVVADSETRVKRSISRNGKISRLKAFDAMLMKVWGDYNAMPNSKPPRILQHKG